MSDLYDRLSKTAQEIRDRTGVPSHDAVAVLGSGLGGYVSMLPGAVGVPYAELGLPVPSAAGHGGIAYSVKMGGNHILLLAGRVHAYEGQPSEVVTYAVRAAILAGASKAVLTNAAGGCGDGIGPGDLVLITDHLNMSGISPLMGENDERLGPRFPDMSDAYTPELRAKARAAAEAVGQTLKEAPTPRYGRCILQVVERAPMGWRTVEFRLEDPDSATCQEFLQQMASFGAFHGCSPDFERSGSHDDEGWVVFTLEGNSLWLNDFTDLFIGGCREIAADIAVGDEKLNKILDAIQSQLEDQRTPIDRNPVVTVARKGRERLERVEGQASFGALIEELGVHVGRVRDVLSQLASVRGSEGWHARIELRRIAAIDAEAVIRTARRLERVARHMCELLSDKHLHKAYNSFMEDTKALVDLRDIAEHLDEYVVGRGKRDESGEQPGPVFESAVTGDDVVVIARGRSLGVLYAAKCAFRLGECLRATAGER
ncbi:MAG: hypothetical protein H0T94_06255 [Acidimicrobiia bacterium]|nr:hypothetical protein [Acidimicrobiia bacterium]